MTRSSLRKNPDKTKLLEKAREAVKPDLKPAPAKPGAAPAQEKRGRKPGTRFPGGYKEARLKNLNPSQPPPAQPAAPAQEKKPGEQAAPGHEKIFQQPRPGEGAGPDARDTSINFGGYEINVGESVEALVEVIFNGILTPVRGEHWKLEPEKVKALAAPLSDILDEILPGISANKWTYRIGAIVAVLGPSLFMDAMLHPESYAWLNFFKKRAHAPKSEPQTTDKKQPDAGAGTEGAGKDLALTSHSQAA